MNIYYTHGQLQFGNCKLSSEQLEYQERAQKAYNRYLNEHKAIKRFYYNTESDTIIPITL